MKTKKGRGRKEEKKEDNEWRKRLERGSGSPETRGMTGKGDEDEIDADGDKNEEKKRLLTIK